jgi:hypothetical protein
MKPENQIRALSTRFSTTHTEPDDWAVENP